MFKWFTSSKNKENESNPLPSEGIITSVGSDEEPRTLAIAIERSDLLERELKLMAERGSQLEEELKLMTERNSQLDNDLKLKDIEIGLQKKNAKISRDKFLKEKCRVCFRTKDSERMDRMMLRKEEEKEALKCKVKNLQTSNNQQQGLLYKKNIEIEKLTDEKKILKEALSILPTWIEKDEKEADALFEKYRELIGRIKDSASEYKDNSALLRSLSKQQAFYMIERNAMKTTLLNIEQEKQRLTDMSKTLKSAYGDYEYVIRNRKTIEKRAAKLKYLDEDMAKRLAEKEAEINVYVGKIEEVNLLKDQLRQEEKLFEREQKWLKREEALLRKQEDRMSEYSASVQRKLYEEIEKNEQMLFIMRSVKALTPVYEQIVKNLVSCLKNERIQYIVSAYLKGKSFYEIAQDMGVPTVRVKRSYMVALNKLKALSAK